MFPFFFFLFVLTFVHSTKVTYTGTFVCPLNETICILPRYKEWDMRDIESHVWTMPFYCFKGSISHRATLPFEGCDGIEIMGMCTDVLHDPQVALFHNCSDQRRVQECTHTLPKVSILRNDYEHQYKVNLLNQGWFHSRREGRKLSEQLLPHLSHDVKHWLYGDDFTTTLPMPKFYNVSIIEEEEEGKLEENEEDEVTKLL